MLDIYSFKSFLSTGLCGIFLYIILDFIVKYNKLKHLPGPTPLPIIGTMYNFDQFMYPSRYLRDLREKYGPVFVCWFGAIPWVSISTYNEAREILTQEKIYTKDETYSSYISLAFGDGLITVVDREKHRQDKLLLFPFFHQDAVDKAVPVMVENTKKMIAEVFDQEERMFIPEFNIYSFFLTLSFRFITKYTMDFNCKSKESIANDLIHMFTEANCYATISSVYRLPSYIYLNPMAKYLANLQYKVSLLVDEELEQRNEKSKNDCLQVLFNSGMKRKDIYGHICTLIGAGHHTTSYLMSMCILMLAKNPAVQVNVYEEIQRVLPQQQQNNWKELTADDLRKLVYLQAVMKECMRLHSIVGAVTRKVTKDTVLEKKYRIPSNTLIIVALFLLQKDFRQRHEFRPERWLHGNDEAYSAPGTLLFSYGPRTCIGKTISLTEAMVAIVLLSKKFIFEAIPGYRPRLRKFGVSNHVANGVRVALRRR